MRALTALAFLLLFSFTGCTDKNYKGSEAMANRYTHGDAPEFPEGLDWLNVDKPVKLQDLRGKVVLLDFWTFCCINCMHIIPDLKKLEAKYPGELVVIGVHSAKFLSEQETGNIRQAILRYDIEHPVVNDKDFKIWTSYGANAWPTVVLIDPRGDVVGHHSGEGVFESLDGAISDIIKLNSSLINKTPIKLSLEKNKRPESILSFPGKVLSDETSGRLFITDSNHDRVIITDLEGNVQDIIGSGKPGEKDGPFEEATFFHPQGLALKGEALYIADTENHLIRKADLKTRTISTIAGTGRQVYNRNPRGDARQAGLNSPWDLTIHNNILYIAMAGQHQLWALNLDDNTIRIHAGTGNENIVDGDLKDALLSQPSGITTDGKKLYFADSEVSAVRSADFNPANGRVTTLIGKGLFEFGDIDGDARRARLQHPLGITYHNGKLYVADTYNNKIKIVDPIEHTSRTYAGSGTEGMDDGSLEKAQFNEPGGISYAKGKLYVADTDNNLIRVIDPASGKVSTLELKGLEKLKKPFAFNEKEFNGDKEVLSGVNISKLKTMSLNLSFQNNYELNHEAPSKIRIFSPDGKVNLEKSITSPKTEIDLSGLNGVDKLYSEMVVYYCKEGNEGLCLIKDVLFEINNSPEGKEQLDINYNLSAAK
ncbi:MAG: thioredoxin-like domain-containing protein [Acidobacteriota bacterium]